MSADTMPNGKGITAIGKWRIARTLAWLVVLSIAVVLPVPLQSAGKEFLGLSPVFVAFSGWVILAASYAIYAFLVRRVEKRVPTELDIRHLPRELMLGLAIGVGMFVLVIASLWALGIYTVVPAEWTDWWTDIRAAFSAAFLEELIFRLVAFRLLLEAVGRWPALAASAFLFGAAHLMNQNASWLSALAIAVEAGLVLSAFYLLTGRAWVSIGLHAGWNLAEMGIFGATISGQATSGSLFESRPVANASLILSGGSFGPEASLAAVLVGLIVFFAVMAKNARGTSAAHDQDFWTASRR